MSPRFVLALVVALVWAPPALAKDLQVNSTADGKDASAGDGTCATAGGQCTLRAALEEAQALPTADRVLLPAGTYTLSSGLGISGELTLVGDGARSTVIDAAGNGLPLNVVSGAVEIDGVKVTGGSAGGIDITAGTVTLDHVAVVGNTKTSSGSGPLGGGVYQQTGTLTIRDSTIAGNTARHTSTTVTFGGGLFVGGTTTVSRSTIAGNTATNQSSATYGGGVYDNGTLTLDHVTLAGNAATGGPGLAVAPGKSVTTAASIFGDACTYNGSEKPTETGVNLDATAGTCRLGAASRTGVDPDLSAFGDHGGPTDTLTPGAGSPALDAAASCGALSGDQRGALTPAGPACDLGAVEIGSDRAVTLTALAVSAAPGGDLTYVARVNNLGLDASAGTSLTLTLPAGATVGAIDSPDATCASGPTITCAVGTLAVGQKVTVTVAVKAPATGPLTATAATGGTTPDPAGANDSATVTTPVTASGGPPTGPASGADTVAPKLSRVGLAGRLTAKRGGMLRLRLSEAATVRVVITRGTGRHRRTLRRQTVKLAAGARRIRIAAKGLSRGPSTLTVTATDAAGNRSRAVALHPRITRS